MDSKTPPALVAVATFPQLHAQVARALAAQAHRIAERTALFVPRPALLKTLDERIRAVHGGVLALEGLPGSGTTAVLCQLAATRPCAFWLPDDDAGQGFEALCAQILALGDLPVKLVPPAASRDATALERLLAEAGAGRPIGDPLVVLVDRPPGGDVAALAPPFPAAIPDGIVVVRPCLPGQRLTSQTLGYVSMPEHGARLEQRLAQTAARFGCAPETATRLAERSQGSFLYVRLAVVLAQSGTLAVDELPEGLEALHQRWWAELDERFWRVAASSGAAGEPIELAQGNVNALLTSPDREVRRSAWESYADAHLATKNTMAACLATGVKQDVFMARARRYESSLDAALSASNIPIEVFHNLIATFRRNLPTWHRYWQVRRRALGYDELHVYDVKAPLTGRMPQVPFAQALDWICAGMRPLGAEYVATMRRGVAEQRWVDIYPNQGKRMGAYSSGVAGTHPFILTSYNDDIFGMSTLAHELGHSMHSYYTWQTQPLVYADYSNFVAEVASNFNQAMVRAHLLETRQDRDFRIAVIEEAMSNFHRYFFVMPTLARFELAIHEQVERDEGLTADGMIDLMADLFGEGFGDGVSVDRERVGITWGQFSTHLYSNFYVFQYATGIAAAHALAAGILAERPGAADSYLAFLKAGSSLYPLDALKLAGIDMTDPAPVETAFATLAGYVDQLEALVG